MYKEKKTRNARLKFRRFRRHCCGGKALSSTYSESVFVALGIRHEMRMRHIFICSLSVSTIFLTLSHKSYDFRRRLLIIECVFQSPLQICLKYFSF
jgi:hypothetical protein